ncbi:MAG: glycosyltransferase family 4 protein [Beijerinckiaceae bacterium]
MQKRILLIGPRGISGHEGGVEKFAEEFVKRIPERCRVDVVCLHADGKTPDNVELLKVPSSRIMKTDKAFYLLFALWYYATRRYDRVLILGMNFGLLIPFFRMMVWRRAQIYLRSGSVDYTLAKWGGVMRAVMRFSERMMRRADGLIAVSPSIQRHIAAAGMSAHLVPNGLDKTKRVPLAGREKNTVIAVGRVTEQKNYLTLVAAAAVLGASGPQITIVGGADLSDEVLRLSSAIAKNPGIHVDMAGGRKRADVLDMLSRQSLYVNCSLHEGMSNAIIEAVQQGIPVIISDIEANRDLALPEAFYFPVTDPVALADKIRDALARPEAYVVPLSRFHDWDTVAARVLTILQLPAEQPDTGAGTGLSSAVA